jgi:benzoyl-CoA reductase/2-hydroxyglutaryl-CoA dehydratase subunit BcrC/BadD/HgdB
MCPFIRSCFDLAIKEKYDFLDGMVMPHSCDTIVKVYDIWRYYKPYDFTHFVNVPHMVHQSSLKFFKIELQLLRKALEKFAGSELGDDKLRRAIKLHNEYRALLRELYDLRKPDPPLLSGAEVTKILVASMTIPVQEANELLPQVIEDIKRRREGGPEKRAARVLVYGSEMDDMAFIKLVEDCGANVVMDDLCTGTRHFWYDVPLTADPLDGMVNRYLDKIPCPRTYRQTPGGHEADLENRFGYLKQFAQDFKVNATILYIIRYCDTQELDVPDVRDYLKGQGYPVLHLEDDYNLTTIGQLRTRIQAFLEMIG